MPITIVSTLPKSTPSTNAGVIDDRGSAEPPQDFASMLFGQLFLDKATPLSADSPVTTNSESDQLIADETGEGDASAFLASIGLIPISEVKSDPSTRRADSAVSALPTSDRNAPPNGKSLATKSDALLEGEKEAPQDVQQLAALDSASKGGSAAKIAAASTTTAKDNQSISGANELRAAETNGNMAQHIASTTTPAKTTARSDASLALTTPVHDKRWSSDFAQKIVWLASNNKHTAEMTLTPPDMGSIEISLKMDHDKATATFFSAHADVRESIEASLPRLREMLAGAGVELGQTNVSSESFRQQAESGSGARGDSSRASSGDTGILATTSTGGSSSANLSSQKGNGLVDTFA